MMKEQVLRFSAQIFFTSNKNIFWLFSIELEVYF